MRRQRLAFLAAAALAVAAVMAIPHRLLAQQPEPDFPAMAGRGYLGIEARAVTPELRERSGAPAGLGVLVAEVAEGSPAAAAGLRAGDVLTGIDGLPIDRPDELSREIRHRPGAEVVVEVFRGGSPLELDVRLGRRPAASRWPADAVPLRDWEAWAEQWQRFGEEMGERWGRWGEEMGERWGRWGEEFGQGWERRGEAHGQEWERRFEELGRELERAMEQMDFEGIGVAVEEAMRALEAIDWQRMEREIQQGLEDTERRSDERSGADDGT